MCNVDVGWCARILADTGSVRCVRTRSAARNWRCAHHGHTPLTDIHSDIDTWGHRVHRHPSTHIHPHTHIGTCRTVDERNTTSHTHTHVRTPTGIPFAQPPTGELRWRAPLAEQSWTGVRAATHFVNECYQPLRDGFDVNKKVSEDCLYLNVFTPPNQGDKELPVM